MDASNNHTLLICTVGGTPEPVVQSLLHWQPSAVLFLPSPQTKLVVDTALRSYAEHTERPLSPGCYKSIVVDDPEDFTQTVRRLRSLQPDVLDWINRGGEYRVVVDFTGGTKCMSSALALVARRWPCRFSYVGGHKRTKEGVGVVESGAERVVHPANPWDVLGYQAVEDAVTVFNRGGYTAAAALLDGALNNAKKPEVKRELSTLKAVIDACAAWDRFDHRAAMRRFNDALKNRNDLGAIFPYDASSLVARLESHRDRVARLADQQGPTASWVEDLLCNAHRRADEGRYDDAIARLYRAIEAIAQNALREKHRIDNTGNVSTDRIPEPLRSEWEQRAQDRTLKLGLQDAYALLKALNDPLADTFTELKLDDPQRSPLVARNASILAHGFQPIGEKGFKPLWDAALKLAAVDEQDLPQFPKLPDFVPCGAADPRKS